MTPSDSTRFLRAMMALAEAFGRKVETSVLAVYEQVLADVPIDQLERAIAEAMKTCEFWPPPAVLRRLARVDRTPDEAWCLVLDGIRKAGPQQRVDFGSRVNGAIRQLGGWVHLAGLGGDRLHTWARKEFCRLYEQCADEPGPSEPLDALDPSRPILRLGGAAQVRRNGSAAALPPGPRS